MNPNIAPNLAELDAEEVDTYFPIPLAILQTGDSALEVLESAVSVGVVNAGKGYRQARGQAAFAALLEEAREEAEDHGEPSVPPPLRLFEADMTAVSQEEAEDLWNCALAGAHLVGVFGGDCAEDAQTWLNLHDWGKVYFRIKSDLLWAAIETARREQGLKVKGEFRRLSFREFRVLAAILSAPRNKLDFSFLGWESIQARACGFHNKASFRKGAEYLPAYCQPLSRAQIRLTCDTLEALNFFARVRYAAGPRGGFMAYSVRHDRPALIRAIKIWREGNRAALRAKTAQHRTADLAAFMIGK